MTTEITLSCETRDSRGKGAARRLRQKGAIPAVVYSAGNEATAISLNPLELAKALSTPHRRNTLLTLDVGGNKKTVMLKELQKHPLKRDATHADFVEVDPSKPVVVRVPFAATGRSKPVIAGAKMQVPVRTLKVRVLPTKIPTVIELDTTEFDYGVHRAKDVTMPEGVELLEDPTLTVVTISRPRGTVEGEEGAAAAS